jgi:hypothetical protein
MRARPETRRYTGPMVAPRKLRQVEILKIAAHAHRDPRTVLRVMQGGCHAMVRDGVIEAARRLGIELPEGVVDSSQT